MPILLPLTAHCDGASTFHASPAKSYLEPPFLLPPTYVDVLFSTFALGVDETPPLSTFIDISAFEDRSTLPILSGLPLLVPMKPSKSGATLPRYSMGRHNSGSVHFPHLMTILLLSRNTYHKD
ncbi:hypothetical protein Salmi_Mp127 (mitochondrion) [Salvia miltiorrhiza]|uniref:Uncharacterized protein n=1 Tax=Salvia miltiorrhiza TaxID=226208 RepID=V9P4T9_SALMI|nr:hypothetical protein Salmi_Mp127 [Salvia miltiorrhiza]AGU16655.1 hypothetical protein Salmi_Mp127 [Salvia miltiorrhiza]